MRTTYTKPNSHTQSSAIKALNVTKCICDAAKISKDEWLLIMFEIGCQVAEIETKTPADALELMTDPSYGFWATFITEYIKDDEWLLENDITIITHESYVGFKNTFIKSILKQ